MILRGTFLVMGQLSGLLGKGRRLLRRSGLTFMLGAVSDVKLLWLCDADVRLGSDVATARVLSAKATAGSTISLESCATFCSAYTYFGTEYADEVCNFWLNFMKYADNPKCYCGNTLASTSVLHADTDCSMACANNPAEFCG
jgi:hypothetical protein